MKYKIVFSYDGSKYFGYAIQKNEEMTIQGVLENALKTIFSENIKISASGRTDKGVHALMQVATFSVNKKIDKQKFLYSLNKLTPNDIYIYKVSMVKDDFDARFSCKAKIYEYLINTKEYNPFLRNFEIVETRLNIKKMKECAKIFLGEHNFKNFTSKKEDQDNFVRTIYKISFKKKKDHLIISFKGNGFMKYMVRKLMGAILEVGKNNLSLNEVENFLNEDKREIITYTAPPHALYLKKVIY